MLTTDFDVKLKLILMLVVGLIVLASIIGWLFHHDRHYTRYFTGVLAVMVVQVFILVSLFLIHQ
ncbi:MAG: hypothetical protein LKH74_11070 [Levilactobacillus sp.]|jgi:hypothetical protein|uniref:hypothetical protein n=1 Tax=Levilactobacillus sp. TaxID=2767919 RepID=UPI00258EC631|nr:hypothetical protein [Levilactobacillus sp.]MCI1554451.1 hypothetical protein [Levilactobacillus sp.]MCI1598218.1 hypothetical protein [Levilactobacillus sp.]MCI1606805.1 hypothetical protein [Levilactobacillus sp.]